MATRALLLLLAAVTTAGGATHTAGPLPGVVNVHLICHSHDDVGWNKSPGQYYSGASVVELLPSFHYANGAVQFILSTVVQALQANPARKFHAVEQYYVRKFWSNASPYMRGLMQAAVASGQLSFAGAGLCQHDEATTEYVSMIDQSTAGNRFITDTFGPGVAPRVSSQLDPFGHSATHAAVLSSPTAGYVGVFFGRMDYAEAAVRAVNKTPDFAWQASPSLGASATTLGVFGVNSGYSVSRALCFDLSIGCYTFTDPLSDDVEPDAEDSNVAAFVAAVLAQAAQYGSTYPTDPDRTVHLPFLMGSDFHFEDAEVNFLSIDKLIAAVNANTSSHNVHLFYSTPAEYATARIASPRPLSLRTGDIFPYGDSPHSVWSGYFTSRPALKGYVRDSASVFQAAKQLWAWSGGATTPGTNPLWLLETALGVAQHHDAVSGTSKHVVAQDYALRLAKGRGAAEPLISGWLNALLGPPSQPPGLSFASCDLANGTICALTEGATNGGTPVVLLLYNTQAHGVGGGVPVLVPVGLASSSPGGPSSWAVHGPDGTTPLTAQLLPLSPEDVYLRELYYFAPPTPGGGGSGSMAWLAFRSPPLPPQGYTTVFLTPTAAGGEGTPHTHPSVVTHVQLGGARADAHTRGGSLRRGSVGDGPSITNGGTTLSFDGTTGLLTSLTTSTSAGGTYTLPLHHDLLYYNASVGDAVDGQAGGAYIMRVAEGSTPVRANPGGGGVVNLTLLSGPVLSEARQVFAGWASQVLRLWVNATTPSSFDLAWTVGPVPVGDGVGKEVVSRFTVPGWDTGGTWYTDSNGREFQARRRNFRPQYTLNVTEFVAQNYYPVTLGAYMTNVGGDGAALGVVTDRSQGCASLLDGTMELLVHRRLLVDDSRGVNEALNEPGVNGLGLVVRGVHRVVVVPPPSPPATATVASALRPVMQAALFPVLWRGAALPSGATPSTWAAVPGRAVTYSGLTAPLPPNVELMTVHPWNATAWLVRLTHLYATGEDAALSANATVSLATLFRGVTVTAAVEMTVQANLRLADVPPVTYKIEVDAGEARRRVAGGDAGLKLFLDRPGGSPPVYYEEVTLPVVPPPRPAQPCPSPSSPCSSGRSS